MDTEPVLRHFGANKKRAIEVYTQFVNTAIDQKSRREYYLASEGRMLGSEEFLDEMKHRLGEHMSRRDKRTRKLDLEEILKAAEKATGLRRKEFCTSSKSRLLVMIKEAIIVIGNENGIRVRELADVLGIDASGVSKRREAARKRAADSKEMRNLLKAMRYGIE